MASIEPKDFYLPPYAWEKGYIPWTPTPKQRYFLALKSEEAFFGGAAGPGKTVALLMSALMYVDVPGYSALLLRKHYPQLIMAGGLIDIAKRWLLPSGVQWSEGHSVFTFPESGARIAFGHLTSDDDVYKHQGASYQGIFIDELVENSEFAYRFMFSRLRRTAIQDVPLRMRAASNPGGRGHLWVRERFVDPGSPDRPYVPARIMDNKHLDRESYMKTLDALDPITRAQLLNGDWTARKAGGMFRRETLPVVDGLPEGIARRSVRYWDLAATTGEKSKRTAGVKLTRTVKGGWLIEHCVSGKWNTGTRDNIIMETAKRDGRAVDILIEVEPGSGGLAQVDALTRALTGYRVIGDKATGDKATRAGPLASQCDIGNVSIVRGEWNEGYIDEMEAFPDGEYADRVDATSGGFNYLSGKSVSSLDMAIPERENAPRSVLSDEILSGGRRGPSATNRDLIRGEF